MLTALFDCQYKKPRFSPDFIKKIIPTTKPTTVSKIRELFTKTVEPIKMTTLSTTIEPFTFKIVSSKTDMVELDFEKPEFIEKQTFNSSKKIITEKFIPEYIPMKVLTQNLLFTSAIILTISVIILLIIKFRY